MLQLLSRTTGQQTFSCTICLITRMMLGAFSEISLPKSLKWDPSMLSCEACRYKASQWRINRFLRLLKPTGTRLFRWALPIVCTLMTDSTKNDLERRKKTWIWKVFLSMCLQWGSIGFWRGETASSSYMQFGIVNKYTFSKIKRSSCWSNICFEGSTVLYGGSLLHSASFRS